MDSDGVRTLIYVPRAFHFFIYLLIASFLCNDSNEDVTSVYKKVNSNAVAETCL
jgi:hypothetical protein